jgi:hypothetical protein
VHPAQSTGREDPDAGGDRYRAGGGDRGGTVRASGRGDGEIAYGELGHAVGGGEAGQLLVVQPHRQRALDHADRRWYGARRADRPLDLAGHPKVVRAGQAVCDDGALQGHDRLAGAQGLGDLGADPDVKVRHDHYGMWRVGPPAAEVGN